MSVTAEVRFKDSDWNFNYRRWTFRKRYWVVAIWERETIGPYVGYVSHGRVTFAAGLESLKAHIEANRGNGAYYSLVRSRRKPLGRLP